MWSKVVEETVEPRENHRPWMGDHYPAACLYPGSNLDCGDKPGFDHCTIKSCQTKMACKHVLKYSVDQKQLYSVYYFGF